MQCQNNLKQIALSAHNYESTTGYLPPGSLWMMPSDTPYGVDTNPIGAYNTQWVGTMVHLLPYFEQDNLFKLMMAGAPSDYLSPAAKYAPYWNYASFYNNRGAKIKTLLCPSDSADSAQSDMMIVDYQSSATSFTINFAYFKDPAFGHTNYIGVGGYSGLQTDNYRGVFTNRSKNKLANIPDGTSSTLMFGEYATKNLGGTTYSPSWIGQGNFPSAWGLPVPTTTPNTLYYQYDSRHTGLILFANCDGSVRNVKYVGNSGAGYNNYIYSVGITDGKVIDPEAL